LHTFTKALGTFFCLATAVACAQTAPAATSAATPHPSTAQTTKLAVAKPVVSKPASTTTTSDIATPSKAKAAAAPSPPTPAPSLPFNRGIVVLDAAHGGVDTGSRITDSLLEKDVTLSFAFKLRSLLTARGFTVVMTRDSDAASETATPSAALSLDDRAGLANHAHPLACLLLHATASGTGVHLYSSELDALPSQPLQNPWLSAQAAWVPQSQQLEKNMGQAISRSNTPLVMSRASVRPMDSLTCPALIVELAPSGSDPSSVNDAGNQQRIAEAIAGAMLAWKTQARPPAPAAAAPSLAASIASAPGVTP
jgi:N-acetylmuramoyl-L-alanine amidase